MSRKNEFCFTDSEVFFLCIFGKNGQKWPFFCWKCFILLGWKVLLRYFIFPVVLSTLTARAKHFFHHACSILLQSNITRVACTSITQISRNEFWRFRVLFLVVCLLNDSKATFATLLTSRGALSSHVSFLYWSHILKIVSILHVCILYEACLQQKSTLAIARKCEKTSHLSVHGLKSLVIACIKNSTIY